MKFSSAEDDNMDAFLDLQRAYLKEKARLCKRENNMKSHQTSLAAVGIDKVRPKKFFGRASSKVIPIAVDDVQEEELLGNEQVGAAIKPQRKYVDKLPPVASSDIKARSSDIIHIESPSKKAAKKKKSKKVQLAPIPISASKTTGNLDVESAGDQTSNIRAMAFTAAATASASSVDGTHVKIKKTRAPLIIMKAPADGKVSSLSPHDKKSVERPIVIPKAFLVGYKSNCDSQKSTGVENGVDKERLVFPTVADSSSQERRREIGRMATPGVQAARRIDADGNEEDGDEYYEDEFEEGDDRFTAVNKSKTPFDITGEGAFPVAAPVTVASENKFGFGSYEGDGCIPITSCDDGFASFFGEKIEDVAAEESRSDDDSDGAYGDDGEHQRPDDDHGTHSTSVQRLIVGSFHFDDATEVKDPAAVASTSKGSVSSPTGTGSSGAGQVKSARNGKNRGSEKSTSVEVEDDCDDDYEGDFDEVDDEAEVDVEAGVHDRGQSRQNVDSKANEEVNDEEGLGHIDSDEEEGLGHIDTDGMRDGYADGEDDEDEYSEEFDDV